MPVVRSITVGYLPQPSATPADYAAATDLATVDIVYGAGLGIVPLGTAPLGS